MVGVAGNQTSRVGEILRKLDLPADLIATSEDWGAAADSVRHLNVDLVLFKDHGAIGIAYGLTGF